MFKSINESFDRKFQDINNETIIEKLTECLNKLTEAEMSPEDKRDSDLIRSMLDKLKTRSNAKFSPEEIAVMDKYGIKRDNNFRNLFVDDRELDRRVDTTRSPSWGAPKTNDGNKSLINYADRARKLSKRADNQVFEPSIYRYGNDDLNSHGHNTSSYDSLQDAERTAQGIAMGHNVDKMKVALRDRKRAQATLDTADGEKERTLAKAKATYDKAVKDAESYYDTTTRWAANSKNIAQGEIDSLLNKNKNESKTLKESPSYDLHPQYDARQSFYGKARVDDVNGDLTLYSYNTPVAKITNGKVELLPKWDWSQTTLRHVKEFLKQNGFEASSLAQIKNTYL